MKGLKGSKSRCVGVDWVCLDRCSELGGKNVRKYTGLCGIMWDYVLLFWPKFK